jgi:Protein of unknown function (DUF3558)
VACSERAVLRFMLFVLAISAVALSGCASRPSRLSPPVPAGEQLDLAGYVSKPCTLLLPDRVAARHLGPHGATVQDTTGSACRWNTTAVGHPAITAQASVDHGLELIYQQRATFSLFQPMEVSHYPAVHTTSGGRAPSSGICSTRVGVGDSALLTITADYGTGKSSFSSDPCPDADKVAFEIISQIRAGNP